MTNARNGDAIVSESFLDVRAKLLEIAATYDRIDRAAEAQPLSEGPRGQRELLEEATKILLSDSGDRAAQLQQLFSRDYQSDWRERFGIPAS